MTPTRAQALAKRQQELLIRSTELRLLVATDLGRWQAPLAVADETQRQAQKAWHWLRAHPELPMAAVATLLLMRPRRVIRFCWRWGRRALLARPSAPQQERAGARRAHHAAVEKGGQRRVAGEFSGQQLKNRVGHRHGHQKQGRRLKHLAAGAQDEQDGAKAEQGDPLVAARHPLAQQRRRQHGHPERRGETHRRGLGQR